MAVIEVKNLTKEYQLGALTSLKDNILNLNRRIQGKPTQERKRFKALDDVSFSIEKGEVVGIIGHNGAGKSTLLKHLAKITTPTSGSVNVTGTVAPLIEVGAGFVPDLTGRENIYLNCSIMGLTRKQTAAKIDEIIEFAELEEFIDTPIKRYSSGMAVRLGFSVATSIDADILIVDEVLAVGDLSFQRKSIARMENLIKEKGKTVLIVGHNIRQLERICPRMLLLRHGQLAMDGDSGQVSKSFFDESTQKNSKGLIHDSKLQPATDTEEMEVRSIDVNSVQKVDGISIIPLFSDLIIHINILCHTDINNAEINIGLHNAEMIFVGKASTSLLKNAINLSKGEHTLAVTIQNISLSPGPYGIGLGIYDWARRPIWSGSNLQPISVEISPEYVSKLPIGTLGYFSASWDFTRQKQT